MATANPALAGAAKKRTTKKVTKKTSKKKSEGKYDRNEVFTCPTCKKDITGPWSFKMHQINQHDKTPAQVGLNPRKKESKSKSKKVANPKLAKKA